MRFSSVQFLHSRQCWGVGHWVPSLETALAVCQCLCSVLPQAWCDLVGFGTRRWSMHDIPAPLPHAMISNMHDGLCALATVVCHFISVFQHVCVSMCVSLRICVWMWISRFPIYDTWIQMTLVKVGELGRGSRFSGDWLSWLEWWKGMWRQAALCNFRGLRNTLSNHTSLLLLPKEWNWDSCMHCACFLLPLSLSLLLSWTQGWDQNLDGTKNVYLHSHWLGISCVCDRRETLKGCLKTRMKWQNHRWRFQQTSRWGSQACPLRTPEMKLKHVCLILVVSVSSLGCADGANQRWYFDGEQIKTPICKKRKRLHWLHLHVWFSVLRCPSFK